MSTQLSQSLLNVKIHVQIHFTVVSQFYVHINMELYVNAFMYWKEKVKLVRAEQQR